MRNKLIDLILFNIVWPYRSWRYRRAISKTLRSNERKLARARRTVHTHDIVVFGAAKGVMLERCTICGDISPYFEE